MRVFSNNPPRMLDESLTCRTGVRQPTVNLSEVDRVYAVCLMTERRIIDDASFPNEWPKKEDHEGHEVRWKDGVSKEYGVHGVAVAVDFDICIADGICISVCPVNVFDKLDFPAEQEKIDKQIPNDSGKTLLDRWKADPVRERDCIFCRACEIQCPVQAIKITEGVGPFA